MHILDLLKQWDSSIFLFINGIHSPLFDNFMYVVSAKLTWLPLYFSLLFVLIKNWEKESIWLIVTLILCVVISDQIASGILKGAVQRLRPSHAEHLKGLVHLVRNYSGSQYGFASSHAANAFGIAILSSLILKDKLFILSIFFWASSIAYSRIYLGVHYPLDIVGGIIVAGVVATFCFLILKKIKPALLNIEIQTVKIPVCILALSFVVILIYSFIAV